MSTKFKGILITMDDDYDEKSFEQLQTTFGMVKGVAKVEKIDTEGITDVLIKNRTILTVKNAVLDVLHKVNEGEIKLND